MNQPLSPITPLTSDQKHSVITKTNDYIQLANNIFRLKLKTIEITFNLKGRSSGMYRIKYSKGSVLKHRQREIRYNPLIFAKYFEDNYTTTIPHEVAHYVTDVIYGLKNIKPHGKEWKAVMHEFGADDSVTANYDLSGIPVKKHALFSYRCDCRKHQLTSIRHNRIIKQNRQYYCKACKQTLIFNGNSDVL